MRFFNYRYYLTIKFFFCFVLSFQSVNAKSFKWDIQELWEVNQNGIINAIAAAKDHFITFPQDTVIFRFPAGIFEIGGNGNHSIDVSNIQPGIGGRLIFEGAGKDKTTFVATDRKEHSIFGRNLYRITFKGIHFTRDYNTVTQGTVISVAAGEVILDLHEGFPTPDSLMAIGRQNSAGLYLRKYTDDIENPQIIVNNNTQQAWDTSGTYQIEERVWRIGLKNKNATAPYEAGDIIGVKLKHGGQTYWFSGGDDIAFEDCKWTQKTRGVLRGGIGNIRFSNCSIERSPKVGGRTPCLASPGGGPQCGQPNDPYISNVIIEDCDFSASGDDNIGLFRVNHGIIRNCHSSDAFARGILLHECKNICLENNMLIRNPILWDAGGDGVSKCDWIQDTVTGIYQKTQPADLNIFPNPFENNFNIELNSEIPGNVNLEVLNLNGQVLLSLNQLDFSKSKFRNVIVNTIPQGTYILNLYNQHFCLKQKIIKIK